MGCRARVEGAEGMGKRIHRVQYQALRKVTGAIQGTSIDKVNRMVGTEDVRIHMDNKQA